MVHLSDFDTDVADGAAREAVRGLGVWRRAAFLDPAVVAELAEADAGGWRASEGPAHGFETAEPPPETTAAFAAALGLLGLELRRSPALVRHPPGGHGAPPPEGGVGCLLDLDTDWRSEAGGLLLLLEPEGSVHGWRPEAGALTLYAERRAPLLTMVSPAAGRARHALFACAQAL